MGKLQWEYYGLPASQQRELLDTIAANIGNTRAAILEKDAWGTLVLHALFALPNRKPIVFKGGTSLSKVFQAINRFSEDIDITIGWAELLGEPIDYTKVFCSKSQITKLGERIKNAVAAYAAAFIQPELLKSLQALVGPAIRVEFEVDDGKTNFEKLRIYYPAVADYSGEYFQDSILLEFGARNPITPNARHTVKPELAVHVNSVKWPSANIDVLVPERTFWEKATLIHDEGLRRPPRKENVSRMSRHWFDLAQLANHTIGANALAQLDLLYSVVGVKRDFFSYKFSDYDRCLNGGLRLVPHEELHALLRADYEEMIKIGMFHAAPPAFDAIVQTLTTLETTINAAVIATPQATDAATAHRRK